MTSSIPNSSGHFQDIFASFLCSVGKWRHIVHLCMCQCLTPGEKCQTRHCAYVLFLFYSFFSFFLSRICVFNHVKLWLFGTYCAYWWRAEKCCRSGFKSFCCFDTFQNLSLFELIVPNMNSNCPRLVCERENYKLFSRPLPLLQGISIW